MQKIFNLKKYLAVVILVALVLVSGCVDANKTNSSSNPQPSAAVENTQIAEKEISDALPDTTIYENNQPEPKASEVMHSSVSSVESNSLPYSTPPESSPEQLLAANYSCSELKNVERQIQLLQNEHLQRQELLNRYQSLKSNATVNNDTQSASSYQLQIDELSRIIRSIDQQISSLKSKEAVYSRECYRK